MALSIHFLHLWLGCDGFIAANPILLGLRKRVSIISIMDSGYNVISSQYIREAVSPWNLPIAPSSLAPNVWMVLSMNLSCLLPDIQVQNGRNIASSSLSNSNLTAF